MTEKRLTANRRNALKSTGPRTPEGKAKASMNALKHGLRASSLAVPFLEDPEDWETHRRLVIQDLTPSGYLETVLSERVAAILWRLGRVVRYESDVVSIAIQEAKEGFHAAHEAPEDEKERADMVARVRRLGPKAHVDGMDVGAVLNLVAEALEVDLDNEETAGQVEVPEDFTGDYWQDFKGWTRAGLEAAVQSLKAQASGEYDTTDPWEGALKVAENRVLTAQAGLDSRNAETDKKRRKALLPPEETLEKVSRYETTLERSLYRTIHELQRLQAARGGVALPPPAAVDVDVAV